MKKYYVYKMKRTDEIRTYLAKTEKDIKRCDFVLKVQNSDCINIIYSFTDESGIYDNARFCLNRIMEELGSIIRFDVDSISSERRACWNIKIYDRFIDSSIINKTNAFYSIIENIFDTFEFEYSYNNTRSCVFVSVKES